MVSTNRQYAVRPGVLPERELTDEEVGFAPAGQRVAVRPGVLPEKELTDADVGFAPRAPVERTPKRIPPVPSTLPPKTRATAPTGAPPTAPPEVPSETRIEGVPAEVYPPAPAQPSERIPGMIYYHPGLGEAMRWTFEGKWISAKEPYPPPIPALPRFRTWRELYEQGFTVRTDLPYEQHARLNAIVRMHYSRLPDKWKHPDDAKNLEYIAEKVWLWNELPENMRKYMFADMDREQLQEVFDDPQEVAEVARMAKVGSTWSWADHLVFRSTTHRPEEYPTIGEPRTAERRLTAEERQAKGFEWMLRHKQQFGHEPFPFDYRPFLRMGEVAVGEIFNLLMTGIGAAELLEAKITGKKYEGLCAKAKRNFDLFLRQRDLRRFGVRIPWELTDERAVQIIEQSNTAGGKVIDTVGRMAPWLVGFGLLGAAKKGAAIVGKEALAQAIKRTIGWSIAFGTLRAVEDIVDGVDWKTAVRDGAATALITALLVGPAEGLRIGVGYWRTAEARRLLKDAFAKFGITNPTKKQINYFINHPHRLRQAIMDLYAGRPAIDVQEAMRILDIRGDTISLEQINKAKRAMLKKVHPDVRRMRPAQRLATVDQVNEAASVLTEYVMEHQPSLLKRVGQAIRGRAGKPAEKPVWYHTRPERPTKPLALPAPKPEGAAPAARPAPKPTAEAAKPIITRPSTEAPKATKPIIPPPPSAEAPKVGKPIITPPAETPKAVEAPRPVAKPPIEVAKVPEKAPKMPSEAKPKAKEIAPEAKIKPIEEIIQEAGGKTIKEPAKGKTPVDVMLRDVPIVEVPVDKIKLSKDVPNFKRGASPETGVVPGEELQGEFQRFPKRPIVVWERLNGDLEVITGRGRLDLARRTGEKTIPAQIVREADGFTKEMGLALDAESNILDNRGSVGDYARYFKNTQISEAEARRRGLLQGSKANNGWIIAKHASDDLYSRFDSGAISPEKAAIIAKNAPNNPRVQAAAALKADDLTLDALAAHTRVLAQMEKFASPVKAEQKGLFGFDESAIKQSEMVARQVAIELKKPREVLRVTDQVSKHPEAAKRLGIDVRDPEAIQKAREAAKQRIYELQHVATNPSLYKEMLEKAGSREAPLLQRKLEPKPTEAMAKEAKVPTEKEPTAKPEAPKGAGMAAAVKEGAFGEIGKPTPSKGKAAIEATKPAKPMKIGDAIDTIGAIADGILDPVRQIVAPGSRPGARLAASFMRENLARLAQKTDAARETLKAAKRKFATMSKDAVLDFIDRMERGLPQDSGELNDIAAKMRKLLDERRDIIRAMGKGYLEEYIVNYFPHIWKNPEKAKVVIAKILAKRPLAGRKSFLKHRKIPTIKEGIELGLELVNDNPVDLVLLKLYEMDKFIMGKHLISQLKDHGQIRFVYARAKPPEGYLPLTDSLFQVYLPPGATLTVKEAYDQTLVENLLAIANSLGIKHERLMKLPGAAWGRQKGGKIETRFAAPESVLTHEIGHVLGERYGLMEYILGKRQTAYYKRGAKAGEPKLTKTGKVRTEYADQSPEAKELRKVLNKEWRALADLRYEGKEVPESFKKYVRRKGEKEAVLLQAYIHAPEKFKEVAPTLFERFEHFLNSHPELHPLTELKSSLVLGESEGNIPIPGITKLGSYYAPEPVATVINNHLSPGLRSSRYAAIRATYDLLRRQANALNMVQLTASFFHALNTGLDTAGSMAGLGIRKLFIRGQRLEGLSDIAKGLTVVGPPIKNLWFGNRLYKAMQKDLSEIADPELRKTVEYIIMAGGRAKMDPMYHLRGWNALLDTVGQIVRGKPLQKIAAVAKLPANIAGTVVEAISYPVIQWWVPRLKLAVMRDMILSELERARKYGLSDEQLRLSLAKAWDSVDNRLGQLVYDNLFWNKVLKDGLMLAFRTVGWNLGFIREYAGAPIDLLATPTRLRSGDALISFRMAYVMGITAVYAITGAVITYLLTGKPPQEAKDYAFPPTGRKLPDGTKERLNLPTYTRDAIGYAIRPRETIQNKLHPLWSIVARTLANKDFFGSEIRNPNDPWMKQLRDSIAYIVKQYRPISVQNYLRMREMGTEKTKALIVSATGITTAAGYIRRTRAQRLMLHYILENLPKGAKPKKLAEKAKLRKQLITWLREGKPIESLPWAGFSNEEIARILTIARRPPLADAYSRLTAPQAISVYLVANKEEAKIFAGILIAKMNRLSKSRPDYEDIKAMYEEIRKQDPILQKVEQNPALLISSLLRVDPTHADKEQIKEAIDKELATLQKAIRIKNPDLPDSIVKRKAKMALRRRLRSAAPPKDIDPEGRARYLVAVDRFVPQNSFKEYIIEQIRVLAADYQQGDKSDAEFEAYLKEKAEQRRQAYLYLKTAGVELDEAKDLLEEAMAGRRLRNKRIDAIYRLEERWKQEHGKGR